MIDTARTVFRQPADTLSTEFDRSFVVDNQWTAMTLASLTAPVGPRKVAAYQYY
jgi:hypothetical protein